MPLVFSLMLFLPRALKYCPWSIPYAPPDIYCNPSATSTPTLLRPLTPHTSPNSNLPPIALITSFLFLPFN